MFPPQLHNMKVCGVMWCCTAPAAEAEKALQPMRSVGKPVLDHVGENAKADRIRKAIAAVVKEGQVRTYDMMRIPGGSKAISQGAASTHQMTDAILAKL